MIQMEDLDSKIMQEIRIQYLGNNRVIFYNFFYALTCFKIAKFNSNGIFKPSCVTYTFKNVESVIKCIHTLISKNASCNGSAYYRIITYSRFFYFHMCYCFCSRMMGKSISHIPRYY